jgi:hypothetical protein
MKRTPRVALVSLAASLSGCGAFYAEAEQPQACITVPPQTFTLPTGGLVVAPAGGFQGTFSGQVDLGINDALPDFLVNGSPDNHILRFLSMEASITSSSSAANFNWLEELSLTVTNGVTSDQLAYYGGGMTSGSRVLKIGPLNAANNLVTFLQNGNMVLHLEGSVAIPGGAQIPSSWTASVQGCFYAKVKKTFQEMVDGTK